MVGNHLKKLREERNLTQEEAAQRMGLVRSTYSNYESGKREPDFETLQKMADFFGVNVNSLLGKDKLFEIQEVIDLSSNELMNKKILFNGKELNKNQKQKAIMILREVLRIETQE